MNTQQAKLVLDKINRLFSSVLADDGQASRVEKDLLLEYTRQLYDAFWTESSVSEARQVAKQPPVVKEMPPVKQPEPEENVLDLTIEPAPKKKVAIPEPVVEETVIAPKITIPTPVVEQPPVPKPEPLKATPAPTPVPVDMGNLQKLFEQRSATELSEKLGERRIDDLSKAFAINDRLLYTEELFGKNIQAFNDAIQRLNGYETFLEARSLLIALAEQYNWTEERKMPVSQAFVKIVRRRYS